MLWREILHLPFRDATSAFLFVIGTSIRGSLLIVIAMIAARLLRRRPAAVRHLIWTLAMAGLLLVPLLSLVVPAWRVNFLTELDARGVIENSTLSTGPRAIAADVVAANEPSADDRVASTQSRRPASSRLDSATSPDRQNRRDLLSMTNVYLVLTWVWLVGVAVTLLPLIAGSLALRRLVSRTPQITSGPWLDAFNRIRGPMTAAPVLLLETSQDMPMACGLHRPMILLPAGGESWNPELRQAVLAHELSHVHRRDCMTQWLARLACCGHWFNPLAWWGLRQMLVERERACDDQVLRIGVKPSDYASCLLEVARRGRPALWSSATVAMSRPSHLEGRLLAVLNDQQERRPLSRMQIVAGAAAWVALLAPLTVVRLGVTGGHAQGAEQKAPATAPAARPAAAKPAVADSKADVAPAEAPLQDLDEQVLTADKTAQSTLLRARQSDTFFKLSNPRVERGPRPWPVLVIDYEKTRLGEHAGQLLMVHRAGGPTQTYILIGPFADKEGQIRIDLHLGGPFDPGPPKDAEFYLTRQDMRYGNFIPTFKVSNSAVMGKAPDLTLARDWTKDESARLSQPPPDYSDPNAHPGVGQDTAFAGNGTGGISTRFVSPGHPLLGIEFRAGEWDHEKCLSQVVPVFDVNQPITVEPRLIAKAGYAVGGMNVKAGKFVDAVQLIYMKLRADGSLDPADSYTSDWAGPSDAGKIVKLAGDGRRVIGIDCRRGAILDGLALVVDDKARP